LPCVRERYRAWAVPRSQADQILHAFLPRSPTGPSWALFIIRSIVNRMRSRFVGREILPRASFYFTYRPSFSAREGARTPRPDVRIKSSFSPRVLCSLDRHHPTMRSRNSIRRAVGMRRACRRRRQFPTSLGPLRRDWSSLIGGGATHLGRPGGRAIHPHRPHGGPTTASSFLDNGWDYTAGERAPHGKALRDGYRDRAFL